ncbi:MAG: hypothetical protein ACRECH_10265 [Nitrososphaerales archaeon]
MHFNSDKSPAKHGTPERYRHLGMSELDCIVFGGDTLLISELEEVAKWYPKIDHDLWSVNTYDY